MTNLVEIFFSYAHQDEALMNDVRQQMVVYERNGKILKWHDRRIPAGADWATVIDNRINEAQVILLFFSPDFIDSKYCYETEGKIALRRAEAGEAKLIPVILRPCAWQESPFGKYQALPRDGKPVTRWRNRDEVCLEIARAIMQ